MKKILYITIALLSINLYAVENPFDLEKNMGNLDNDESSLFDELEVTKPTKVVTKPVEVKKPVLVQKPVEIKKPVLLQKPVEIKKPILVQKPVEVKKPTKTSKQIEAEKIDKEKEEIEAYEKRRKAILAKKKAKRLAKAKKEAQNKLDVQAKKDAKAKEDAQAKKEAQTKVVKTNNSNESFDDILSDTSKDKPKTIKKVVKTKVKKHTKRKHTKKKHRKRKHKAKKHHKKHKKTINPPTKDKDEINLKKEAQKRNEMVEKAYRDAVREMSRED